MADIELNPKQTHGGKRTGSGRPRVPTVKITWRVEPEIIERIKLIAKEQNRTESSIVNELLFKSTRTRQEGNEAVHTQHRDAVLSRFAESAIPAVLNSSTARGGFAESAKS